MAAPVPTFKVSVVLERLFGQPISLRNLQIRAPIYSQMCVPCALQLKRILNTEGPVCVCVFLVHFLLKDFFK